MLKYFMYHFNRKTQGPSNSGRNEKNLYLDFSPKKSNPKKEFSVQNYSNLVLAPQIVGNCIIIMPRENL